jgi:hypothetical protein
MKYFIVKKTCFFTTLVVCPKWMLGSDCDLHPRQRLSYPGRSTQRLATVRSLLRWPVSGIVCHQPSHHRYPSEHSSGILKLSCLLAHILQLIMFSFSSSLPCNFCLLRDLEVLRNYIVYVVVNANRL